MKAFTYKAALLCFDCGLRTRVDLTLAGKAPATPCDESSYDSDDYPKGPFSQGGGEADTPQHCDHCGQFLQNPLTEDGYNYARTCAAPFDSHGFTWDEVAKRAESGGRPALAEWIRFYFAYGQ